MLIDGGWDDVSIREVAQRSGVARATINRRWRSKAGLVVHALSGDPEAMGPPMARPAVRLALAGLLSAAARDPDLRSELRELLFGPIGPDPDGAARAAIAAAAVLVTDLLAVDDDPRLAAIRARIDAHLATAMPT
ncbi:TetR/AcrR family transcriptional regulator [Williamsia sp. CHRR-6]|uniref:TetR/AcrR family transcriptional regulator n=1 Tax=Williamsia sp. CHRR-6 TaxID=2835871 RepID=UPI001BDA138C|nr:helix-turn-helix domain-containing protein [Williamsia sp. CHRR-6]MBT0567289.1 helix-turn-helix transcriptional regulator [Williamsia sp. CHRR-6]